MDKVICDRCDNYSVSPDCTTESCYAQRRVNGLINRITDLYVKERMNGNKSHCKEFVKLDEEFGL